MAYVNPSYSRCLIINITVSYSYRGGHFRIYLIMSSALPLHAVTTSEGETHPVIRRITKSMMNHEIFLLSSSPRGSNNMDNLHILCK
jgi:hypothetical protein